MHRSTPLLALTLLLACASPQQEAERMIAEGNPDQAIATLEQRVADDPGSAEARNALAWAHYRVARQALDAGDEARYAEHLEGSLRAAVAAVELDPRDPSPHILMGIIAAYRGDLDSSLTNLQNAAQLAPQSSVSFTNLAEVHIYRGELAAARMRLDRARKLGTGPHVELTEVLAAWRYGDYTEARDLFDTAYGLNPEFVRRWNEAPVEEPIESFEDLTAFCCSHVACGPYMADACRDMNRRVAERRVSAETLRRELEIEMERRRRMRKIYEEERGLEIEVEPVPDEAP